MGLAVKHPTGQVSIHPTVVVDEGAIIGSGTQVWHFSHIMAGARVGRDCRLGQNVFVGRGVTIGNRVKIQNNVSVYRGVTLEDDVFCGPSAVFTNVKDPRSAFPKDPLKGFRKTRVGRSATIGANATIICGVKVGEQAFIGAGAVVTHDVPAFALVYGNPATLQGWVCYCGERLPFALTSRRARGGCARCHRTFEQNGQRVRGMIAVRGTSSGQTNVTSRPNRQNRFAGIRVSRYQSDNP